MTSESDHEAAETAATDQGRGAGRSPDLGAALAITGGAPEIVEAARRAANSVTSALKPSASVIDKLTANIKGFTTVETALAAIIKESTKGLHASTSGAAGLINSNKMFTAWQQPLLSGAAAHTLKATMAVPQTSALLLRDIVRANTATALAVGRYAELNKNRFVAPLISARPSRQLKSFLAGMPVSPHVDQLTLAAQGSRSVAGITAADILITQGAIEVESAGLFDSEIVEPWIAGPAAARESLYRRLGALDPYVPDLLRGAWSQVENNGPAAIEMAAHAVQEAIDRTLRAAAPNQLVLSLHAAGSIPKSSIQEDNNNKPTRAGRIAAILHQRQPGDRRLITGLTKAIVESLNYLTGRLQAARHASKGTIDLIRTWLVAVEATLTQLLYEPSG